MHISEKKTDFQKAFQKKGKYYFHIKAKKIDGQFLWVKFREADNDVSISKKNITNWALVTVGDCYIMEVNVIQRWSSTSMNNNNCPHRMIFNTSTKTPLVPMDDNGPKP